MPGYFDGEFHTFQFGSSWTNLLSVDFLLTYVNFNFVGFAWDNIVVEPVPEPDSGKLVLFGLLSIVGAWLARQLRTS